MRPHRIQRSVIQAELEQALGPEAAARVMAAAGVSDLPELLPEGPRSLAALQAELDPAVRLYRALLPLLPRAEALAVIRRIIVRSGFVGHDDQARRQLSDPHDISLTSPPPGPVPLTPDELQQAFARKLAFFSCEGVLHTYTPDEVRFTITRCNWCEAMRAAGTPELTAFFCETDELTMAGHPTHDFERPTTIFHGDGRCNFAFVRRTAGARSIAHDAGGTKHE